MNIIRRRGWELPEREATPEDAALNRRRFAAGLGAGLVAASAPALAQAPARAADPTADLYPAKRNERFTLDRPITDEMIASNYNNFYEFGSFKRVASAAQALRTRPWTVKIDGLVEQPLEIGIDGLVRRFPLEERLTRLRCVEAWAMAIPWTGFPLKDLVAFAKPLSGARYVEFRSFLDPSIAPGQKQTWYPWPYLEGITIAEATNELAFMVTGAYGKPLPRQFGAPIRLALPWKYGFKSAKSVNRITFTDKRPKSFWEQLQPSEYGFWANVNPAVPHPRWPQSTEEMIGTGERRPTQLYNGYGEFVASLYAGVEGEKLYL